MPVHRDSLPNTSCDHCNCGNALVEQPMHVEKDASGTDCLKKQAKRRALVRAYRTILETVLGAKGASDEGVERTPERCADAMLEMTCGYDMTASNVVNGALFREPLLANISNPDPQYYGSQLVIVRDISVHSLCEHHILPFHGVVHIAYIPSCSGMVLGLSKVARIVEVYARRLQLQERLGHQIAQAILDETGARGSAVRIEARYVY